MKANTDIKTTAMMLLQAYFRPNHTEASIIYRARYWALGVHWGASRSPELQGSWRIPAKWLTSTQHELPSSYAVTVLVSGPGGVREAEGSFPETFLSCSDSQRPYSPAFWRLVGLVLCCGRGVGLLLWEEHSAVAFVTSFPSPTSRQ